MSDINIKAELKKGYLMFRAFEHGMKLAEEIDNIEGVLQTKRKELIDIDAKIKTSGGILDKELDKISDEIEQLRKKELEELEAFKKQNAESKYALEKKLASINESIKKAETKIASKNKDVDDLDVQIAQKKADLDKFNKEIEETKAKFRSMF